MAVSFQAPSGNACGMQITNVTNAQKCSTPAVTDETWRHYQEVDCRHWDYVPTEGDDVPHWAMWPE